MDVLSLWLVVGKVALMTFLKSNNTETSCTEGLPVQKRNWPC